MTQLASSELPVVLEWFQYVPGPHLLNSEQNWLLCPLVALNLPAGHMLQVKFSSVGMIGAVSKSSTAGRIPVKSHIAILVIRKKGGSMPIPQILLRFIITHFRKTSEASTLRTNRVPQYI